MINIKTSIFYLFGFKLCLFNYILADFKPYLYQQVRKVIKTDLQMSREMHILRAQRITTGPQIRGTHPIVVSFENYRDKVRCIYLYN